MSTPYVHRPYIFMRPGRRIGSTRQQYRHGVGSNMQVHASRHNKQLGTYMSDRGGTGVIERVRRIWASVGTPPSIICQVLGPSRDRVEIDLEVSDLWTKTNSNF